jgi:predicted O-methyltransferase YrrM
MTQPSAEFTHGPEHNLITFTFDRPLTELEIEELKWKLGATEAVRVPPAVRAGYARAASMGFGVSSTPEVGQLLSALAAAVPIGGRILEMGTGVGVGLGWIVHGLGDRTDVAVTSMEIDANLARLVRSFEWPSWVSIAVGNCWEIIGSIGLFDLIFVDIPGKDTYDLESPIKALAPGGVLIIDDIAHVQSERKERQDRLNFVRSQLIEHPELRCAELDFSSGVLMAVRCHK